MKKLANNLMYGLLTSVFIVSFLLLSACFDSECSCFESGGLDSELTENHGHDLLVPAADFTNPVDGTYSIQHEADHDHEVIFPAEELEGVSGLNSFTVLSSPGGIDGHQHTVTLDCACN